MYLFISASKKIVGCVVAERIESAFPIVPSDQGDSKVHCDLVSSANRLKLSEKKSKSSTQLLWGGWKFNREVVNRKKARNDNQQDLGRAILCSKSGVPAVCGVRGIWVSRSERRKGVASHLLDAMRLVVSSCWSTLLRSLCHVRLLTFSPKYLLFLSAGKHSV